MKTKPSVTIVILLLFTVLVIPTTLVYVAIQFAAVFEGFGAELPLITKAFLPDSPIYYVLPLTALAGIISHTLGLKYGWRLLVVSAASACVMVPVFFFSMYLPIFQLGAVAAK